jgi:hypothetical protein
MLLEPIQEVYVPGRTIFIITWCRDLRQLYGSEMVFRTLRTGFPDDVVEVIDNDSLPTARRRLARLARRHGCRFRRIRATPHHDLLAGLIADREGELVFVDPDVVFWKRCDDLVFDALLAGRRLPAFHDLTFTGRPSQAMPRLHTSFLWVPDAARLRTRIEQLMEEHPDFDPFRPYAFRQGESWIRFDSGASLYASLDPGETHAFTDAELDRFDHLFCGSHYPVIREYLSAAARELGDRLHTAVASGDLSALRGAWRDQEAVLNRS